MFVYIGPTPSFSDADIQELFGKRFMMQFIGSKQHTTTTLEMKTSPRRLYRI